MNLHENEKHQVGVRVAARPDGDRRSSIDALVERDSLLRLHCATWPSGAVEPYPWHPRHRTGTRSVLLGALRSGEGDLLARVLANRTDPGEDALSHFVGHFVRPLVKTVRIALERYRVALLRTRDEERIGFELSPDLRATGRIVIHTVDGLDANAPASPADIVASMRALNRCLNVLGAAFRVSDRSARDIEGAVFDAAARELRFLSPELARLLSDERAPWGLAHGPTVEQDAVLREVLRRVETRARERAADPARPIPAVVIDVDLCAFVPRERTLAAARSIGGPQPGAPYGIRALLEPERLAVLPVHHEAGWSEFVKGYRLDDEYPEVDWIGLRAQFELAYHRPWENLRHDTLTPGLARFVRDVLQAGGEVVFNSGRRDRVRSHTEYVLTRAGILSARLLTMPDDRIRPVAELKVENMRQLPAVDVVAFFDDLADNRAAMARAYPGAMTVAVRIPGFAGERTGTGSSIATFEMRPRVHVPSRGEVPAPTAAQSLGKLAIAELSAPSWVADHAVHLSAEQSRALVHRLIARTEEDADQTARTALEHARAELPNGDEPTRALFAIHHVLTRGQFLKGSRSNYPLATAKLDMGPYIAQRAPLRVVMLGFPVKHGDSKLKAFGPLPDFAEMAALVRLRELVRTIQRVYEPGLELTVLTDSQHFRRHRVDVAGAYNRKLREYRGLVASDGIAFHDIDELAEERLGPGTRERREARIAEEEERLRAALEGLSIARDPLGALRVTASRDVGAAPRLGFEELFRSLVHSVPLPPPPSGQSQLLWSKALYADVYHLTDPEVAESVLEGRAILLRTTWEHTIRYAAAVRVDRMQPEYGEPVSPRVRLAAVPRPGCCGYSFLGGSTLLPWHGTGAVDARGYVSTEFAIALLDQGFVPVYSPLLGDEQPWMMVPASATQVPHRGAPAELEPGFVRTIRLRRSS